MSVPLIRTCSALMFETADFGMVTFAKAVVPAWPLAAKLSRVELPVKLVIVASLKTVAVQPVPQLALVEEDTLNVIVAECSSAPLLPVTVTV